MNTDELKAVIRELLDALDAEAKAEARYNEAKAIYPNDCLGEYESDFGEAAFHVYLAVQKAREAIK